MKRAPAPSAKDLRDSGCNGAYMFRRRDRASEGADRPTTKTS